MPVILQMTPTECGAACLAMLLSFHGRRTSLREARRELDPGRDGTTALAVANAARAAGLKVRAFSGGPSDLGALSLPALVNWRTAHFVVLERWTPQRATIVDPAYGRLEVARDEVDELFGGVSMSFEPSETFERRSRSVREPRWGHLLCELRNLKRDVGAILASSLVLQLAGLAIPVATAVMVDRVIPANDTAWLPLLAVAAALLVINHWIVSYVRERLLIGLRARVEVSFTNRLVEHLLALPLSFFERRGAGDLLSRIAGTPAIQQVMGGPAIAAVLDGGFVVVYVVILFASDVGFAALALALGAVQVVTYLKVTRSMTPLLRRELAARAATHNAVVHMLSGIATLKAAAAEQRARDMWSSLYSSEVAQTVAVARAQATNTTISSASRFFAPLALLLYGAYGVMTEAMSLGIMFALIALASAALMPLASLVATAVQIQRAGAYLDRLVDVLGTEPERQMLRGTSRRRLSGNVEARNVSFRFERGAPLVLNGVSLVVRQGETIGIAGRSGSGKTTLAKLLIGLHLPTEGEVRYDGVPLDDHDIGSLRAQLGVVMQDSAVFGGTIRENIALHDPELPLDRVVEAAEIAAFHEDVMSMPLGYETPVGAGGTYLSGGQLQRLALARAVVREPALLVLDEATSHLDAVTEETVMRNLSRLPCTRIVVAHRLSSIRDSDRIIVLREGAVGEEGTHRELLARDGDYASLVRRQIESKPAAA